MVLLVPVQPEVPKTLEPSFWPGLVLVLLLSVFFLEAHDTIVNDSNYIESLNFLIVDGKNVRTQLTEEEHRYLEHRPLNKIAPCKGSWNIPKLIFANFVHGSFAHLALNLVGAFAGARILSTFIPFLCTLSIFLIGGSLGLLVSILFSSDLSPYVPHVGSSGGVFSMLGAYYVYNFSYRTRYFFWFPSRHGMINLKTASFFFLDVILMELILSAAQLFPMRIDGVDHLAHVTGFLSGICVALFLRSVQRWPCFLQSRIEFVYWSKMDRPRNFDPVRLPLLMWLRLLDINPYNDRIKLKVCQLITRHGKNLENAEIEPIFRFLNPTFLNLHQGASAELMRTLLMERKIIPLSWYSRIPYDSVIRIAKFLAQPVEHQSLLYQFILDYRRAHEGSRNLDRKLEFLMHKLDGLMVKGGGAQGGKTGNVI